MGNFNRSQWQSGTLRKKFIKKEIKEYLIKINAESKLIKNNPVFYSSSDYEYSDNL